MPAQMVVAESSARSHRLVRAWLAGLAALVFAMVIVGGATRLTDSGLSITEWQLLLGAIPPLGEADWQAAFAKYREIPEYHIVNRGMSLEEFKVIYWWEWAHRFLGRFIGLAFIVPFALLWLTGHIERALVPRLLALFVIGGLQGALGWFMVMSGLAERVDVSEYRLAAHLTLAAVIYGAIVWVALGIGRPPRAFAADRTAAAALGFILLVLLQIAAGGFVAGLDAGMGFNTWPLMEGRLIPEGLFAMAPSWRNLFENAMTVQFNHRLLGYLVVAAALFHAWRVAATPHAGVHRASAFVVAAVALAQVALGIATLLHQVPVGLALVHQGGALVLLTAALWHLHRLMVISPSPDRGRQ